MSIALVIIHEADTRKIILISRIDSVTRETAKEKHIQQLQANHMTQTCKILAEWAN